MTGSGFRVSIQIDCPAWRKAWPGLVAEARGFVRAAAARPEFSPPSGEVAIVLADDQRLQGLNVRFRAKDRPTNVLSFPDPAQPLGGIALAYETVASEAKAQKKAFVNHSKHLILHGFLHLLGYDHETPRDARLMEGLEIAILTDMGIPNPYILKANARA
jgi:probable rRNA maturation factor